MAFHSKKFPVPPTFLPTLWPAWVSRLIVDCFVARFGKTPASLRKKLDKSSCEAEAEAAAFVTNLCKEIQQTMPIPQDILEAELLEKWVPEPLAHTLVLLVWIDSATMFSDCAALHARLSQCSPPR